MTDNKWKKMERLSDILLFIATIILIITTLWFTAD